MTGDDIEAIQDLIAIYEDLDRDHVWFKFCGKRRSRLLQQGGLWIIG